MKIVQSLWTRPLEVGGEVGGHPAGWRDPRHYWYSWVLSAHRAKKAHGTVELVTDSPGARILIDRLRLPYDRVLTDLDGLSAPFGIRVAGKLATYRSQTEPFIHIDGDVVLCDPLPERITSAPIAVQNREGDPAWGVRYPSWWHESYGHAEDYIRRYFRYRPPFYDANLVDRVAFNTGLFGGTDLDLIHAYADDAMRLITHPANRSVWAQLVRAGSVHVGRFDSAIERGTLAMFLRHRCVAPEELLGDADPAFANTDTGTGAVKGAKNDPDLARQLASRVKSEHPKAFAEVERIVSGVRIKPPVSAAFGHAHSFAASPAGSAAAGTVDNTTLSLRILSCHGVKDGVRVQPPCNMREYNEEGRFHYCAACGGGDGETARLDAIGSDPGNPTFAPQDYAKLGYPHLLCPHARPGFYGAANAPRKVGNLHHASRGKRQSGDEPRTFAVVTVYDGPAILPHFLDHYAKLGVDRILVVTTLDLPRQAEWERLYPVTFSRSHTKVFSNEDKARGEMRMLREAGAGADDWVLHLDLDEFHQYPTDLKSLGRLMDRAGIDAIEGTMLDRVSEDGVMRPFTDAPIDDQFPLQSKLTRRNRGTIEKIMLARFKVAVGSGRHRTTDGTFARRYPIGDASDYRVHHFRWADGLLERLEGRFTRMVERYPDRVYPAANLAFCAQYRRTGRIDLEDPILDTRPAPRLQYPSPNRAADILASMAPNPYAIDDFDSAALFGLAREVRPRHVLEFGPGRSTLVWAFLGCEVDALEYDAAEYRWISRLLAPLANVRVHPHGRPIDTPLPYARYDLAFVDGPSGRNYAGHTRLDAVLFAVARADIVLLHDSTRAGERETLDHMAKLGYDFRSLTADGRGLAVITKRQG